MVTAPRRTAASILQVPIVVYELNRDGQILSGDLRGQTYLSLMSEADRPRVAELMARAFDGEVCSFECPMILGGDEQIVASFFVPLPGPDGSVARVSTIIKDITERTHSSEALRTPREQLRRLSARVHIAIEQERTDLARELHDQIGQWLTAFKMDVAWIGDRLSPDPDALVAVHEKLAAMNAAIDGTIGRIRRISAGLRPIAFDRIGLLEAIDWLAKEFERKTGVRCRFDHRSDTLDIERERATQIFRIIQEALVNTTRHAGATRVTIVARLAGGSVRLEVRDNGCGISDAALASPDALGLLGMRERARLAGGELTISRAGRRGTIVTMTVPVRTHRPAVKR